MLHFLFLLIPAINDCDVNDVYYLEPSEWKNFPHDTEKVDAAYKAYYTFVSAYDSALKKIQDDSLTDEGKRSAVISMGASLQTFMNSKVELLRNEKVGFMRAHLMELELQSKYGKLLAQSGDEPSSNSIFESVEPFWEGTVASLELYKRRIQSCKLLNNDAKAQELLSESLQLPLIKSPELVPEEFFDTLFSYLEYCATIKMFQQSADEAVDIYHKMFQLCHANQIFPIQLSGHWINYENAFSYSQKSFSEKQVWIDAFINNLTTDYDQSLTPDEKGDRVLNNIFSLDKYAIRQGALQQAGTNELHLKTAFMCPEMKKLSNNCKAYAEQTQGR